MAAQMLRSVWRPSGLALLLVLAACERDRSLERRPDPAAAPTAAPVTATEGALQLVQDRGRASWALVELPEVPPEAAPDPAEAPADPQAPPERRWPFPEVAGLDEALEAVPLLLQQAPLAQLTQGSAPGFQAAGRGDLVLQLENRPEPEAREDGRRSTATPDRLRMTLDVADDQLPDLRIEPVRALGLTPHGAYASWGPWPSIYGGWFLGNVVVDRRTVDQNHLMYLHAEPVPGSARADGSDPSPTYTVHVVVLPVLLEGTVPQMQELAALARLSGEASPDEEPGAAEAPEDPSARRALHLVFLDVRREVRQAAAATTD